MGWLAWADWQASFARDAHWLTHDSVAYNLILSYLSSKAMVSSLAARRFLNLCPHNRSTFNDPNSVSLQALSQQFPRRFIELVMP
jgi:hypothetical protein